MYSITWYAEEILFGFLTKSSFETCDFWWYSILGWPNDLSEKAFRTLQRLWNPCRVFKTSSFIYITQYLSHLSPQKITCVSSKGRQDSAFVMQSLFNIWNAFPTAGYVKQGLLRLYWLLALHISHLLFASLFEGLHVSSLQLKFCSSLYVLRKIFIWSINTFSR